MVSHVKRKTKPKKSQAWGWLYILDLTRHSILMYYFIIKKHGRRWQSEITLVHRDMLQNKSFKIHVIKINENLTANQAICITSKNLLRKIWFHKTLALHLEISSFVFDMRDRLSICSFFMYFQDEEIQLIYSLFEIMPYL